MKHSRAQDAICQALEAAGATVWPSVDGHPPHLLVTYKGQLYGANVLRADGGGWPTWHSPEDALRAIDARLSVFTTTNSEAPMTKTPTDTTVERAALVAHYDLQRASYQLEADEMALLARTVRVLRDADVIEEYECIVLRNR